MHAFTSLLVWLPRFGIVWSTRPGAAMNSRSSHVVTSPTFLEFPQNHSATKLYISSQIFWQITRYLVLLNNDYTSRNIEFGRRQNQTQWPPWLPWNLSPSPRKLDLRGLSQVFWKTVRFTTTRSWFSVHIRVKFFVSVLKY